MNHSKSTLLRVSTDVRDRVKIEAKARGMTMSKLANKILNKWLKKPEKFPLSDFTPEFLEKLVNKGRSDFSEIWRGGKRGEN